MGKSGYLEDALIGSVLGGAAYTPPSNLYLALYSAGTNLEANLHTDELDNATTAPGYARVAATFTRTGAGLYELAADTAVLTATGQWLSGNPVTHFAVTDNATKGAGNVLYWEALTNPKAVANGEPVQWKAGDLTVKEN